MIKQLTTEQRKFLKRVQQIYSTTDRSKYLSYYPVRVELILKSGYYYMDRAAGVMNNDIHEYDVLVLNKLAQEYRIHLKSKKQK